LREKGTTKCSFANVHSLSATDPIQEKTLEDKDLNLKALIIV